MSHVKRRGRSGKPEDLPPRPGHERVESEVVGDEGGGGWGGDEVWVYRKKSRKPGAERDVPRGP